MKNIPNVSDNSLITEAVGNYNSSFDVIYNRLLQTWLSPFVARSEVHTFSGGLISPKTLANADSENNGPQEKFYFGKRKVFYSKESLAKWIAEHCSYKN